MAARRREDLPVLDDLIVVSACMPSSRDSLYLPRSGPGDHSRFSEQRHFNASVLLDSGESVKALSAYLGHADAGFTLRTYTHRLPSSEARTRNAVDEMCRTARRPPTAP